MSMNQEWKIHEEDVVQLSDGSLQIDLRDVDGDRLTAIVGGGDSSPLDSGRFFVELVTGRVHRLGLAENPPAGDYTVVVLDPEAPRRPPWVSRIQIRDIRG
jgi:hypothetical protein